MLIPHPYFEFLIQDHYPTITFLPHSIAYPLIVEYTFLTPPSSMNILPTIQAHLPTSLVYHYTPCTYPWDEVTDYFFHKQGYNWFCYQRICVTSWQQRSRTHRPESCTMASIEILSSYLQTIMHSRSSRETGGTMVGGLDQRHLVWQNHTQARTQAKPCDLLWYMSVVRFFSGILLQQLTGNDHKLSGKIFRLRGRLPRSSTVATTVSPVTLRIVIPRESTSLIVVNSDLSSSGYSEPSRMVLPGAIS